jgi:hypothetical protein
VNGTFLLILIANAVTLVVSAVATFRRPILSYVLVTALAFVASICAFLQFATGESSILSSISTLLLLATIIWRALLNATERAKAHKDKG